MAATFLKAAESELSCPVCLELFIEPNTPKDLPGCDHVICEICLKKMVKDARGRNKIVKCPECRKDVAIPKDGVDALRTNRKIRNLAEKHPREVQEKRQSSRKSRGTEVPTCLHHAGEKMHFYCTTCNEPVCQACLVLKHKNHEIEEAKDRYGEQKEEMQTMLSEMKAKILKCKKTLNELKALKKQVKDSQKKEEQKIDQAVEMCINKVLEKAQDLKNRLQDAGRKKQQKIDEQVHQLEEQIETAERQHMTASDTLANSTEYEYVAQHVQQREKLEKISVQTPRVNLSGKAAAAFTTLEPDINLGTLVFENQGRSQSKGPVTLTEQQTICNIRPYRMTFTTNGCLIMTNFYEYKIIIYQKHQGQFTQLKAWDTARDLHPRGVATAMNGNVYVAMYKSICVYSPTGRLVRDIRGKDADDSMCSVDITTDGRVLVGHCLKYNIDVYNENGQLIRTIRTNIHPRFMITINDTHVAMSGDDRVSVIGIESGQETLNIAIPNVRGICYDEPTNSLLAVANEGKDIEQYDFTTGRFVACLMKGLNNVQDIALSSDGVLAVAELNCVKLLRIN